MTRPAFIVLSVAVGIFAAVACSWFQWAMPVGPRFTPTDIAVARAMLALAATRPGELVADLGCGDGRIVIEAVRSFDARGRCVEIDPDVLQDARANARMAGVSDRIEFVLGDVLDADLDGVDVVTLYLSPDLNRALRPKLQAMRPGSRVVANSNEIPGWEPTERVTLTDRGRQRELMLWRINGRLPDNRQAWGR